MGEDICEDVSMTAEIIVIILLGTISLNYFLNTLSCPYLFNFCNFRW